MNSRISHMYHLHFIQCKDELKVVFIRKTFNILINGHLYIVWKYIQYFIVRCGLSKARKDKECQDYRYTLFIIIYNLVLLLPHISIACWPIRIVCVVPILCWMDPSRLARWILAGESCLPFRASTPIGTKLQPVHVEMTLSFVLLYWPSSSKNRRNHPCVSHLGL